MARSDHFALLVAINSYPGLSNLAGPENDAVEFAEWLKEPSGGDIDEKNVLVIRSGDFDLAADPYDANPTEREVIRALDRWLRLPGGWRERVGERLYLFFAGHGFTAGSSISDPALFSAVAQSGDTAHIAAYRYASKIANAGFFDEIVLVMDCCQDVLKATAVVEPSWAPPDRNKASQVKLMQAYGAPRGKKAFERAMMAGAPVRGLFSSVWIEALRTARADEDGRVTGALVKERLQRLWSERYRDECDYDPPVRLPDGQDICLLRRGGRRSRALPEPMAPFSNFVELPGPDLVSAAPILGTRTSHEYQHFPARDLARRLDLQVAEPNADAELFVFMRDSRPSAAGAWQQLVTIHDVAIDRLDRDQSYALSLTFGKSDYSNFAAARLALSGGVYAIRVKGSEAGAELLVSVPVQLVKGWRTEVYVDCVDGDTSIGSARVRVRVLDLAQSTVLMAQIGEESPLASATALQTERGRKMLSAGLPIEPDKSIRDLLLSAPASPMLTLYVAFHLATNQQADVERVRDCLEMLPSEFKDASTDVVILERWCARSANTPFPGVRHAELPPILAVTWDLARLLPEALGLAPALQASVGQWRLGGSVWASWKRPSHVVLELQRYSSVSAFVGARPSSADPAPTIDERLRALSMADAWRPAASGLRVPRLNQTPFQQALRRRVLNLLAEDEPWSPDMVVELAAAFGLQKEVVLHASQRLLGEALSEVRFDQAPRLLTPR